MELAKKLAANAIAKERIQQFREEDQTTQSGSLRPYTGHLLYRLVIHPLRAMYAVLEAETKFNRRNEIINANSLRDNYQVVIRGVQQAMLRWEHVVNRHVRGECAQ